MLNDPIRNYEIEYYNLWQGIRVGQRLIEQVEAVDACQALDIFYDDQADDETEVLKVTCTD